MLSIAGQSLFDLEREDPAMRQKDPELMENILNYINEYYLENEATPSTTEIADAMSIARGTAYKYLAEMDARDMLQYEDGEITTSAMSKILNIPLAGTVQTGSWFQPVRADVPMVPERNR